MQNFDPLENPPPEILKIAHVLVDYDEPNAIAQAIKVARFDKKELELDPEEIPLRRSGKVWRDVYDVWPNRLIFGDELLDILGERSLEFADVLTTITSVKSIREKLLKHDFVIHFSDYSERFYGLTIDAFILHQYCLRIFKSRPKVRWREGNHFLAVPVAPHSWAP